MKNAILILFFTVAADLSYAQVMQKKMNTSVKTANTNIKTMSTQQNTTHPIPKKAVESSNIKLVNIIPLNSKNEAYKRYVSNQKINPSINRNNPLFSKQYLFEDGTKLKVTVVNPKSNLLLMPSNLSQPKPNTTKASQDDQNNCTTTNITLRDNSNTFMNNNYAGQSPFIYPGAIYTYNNLFSGNFNGEKNGRNTIVIYTDNTNMTGNSYEIVENPDEVSIHNAITQLKQRFTTIPSSTSQLDMAQRVYEASSASDMAIKFGVDASGYGGSFSAYVNTQKSQQSEYLTIDCMKPLFTISVAMPDSGYFKKAANANPANLVVIGTVTYGTRLLANLKANFQSSTDQDGFDAGYSGWGVQAHANLDFFSSNSSVDNTINAYYVGGPASTKPSFNKAELEDEIKNFFASSNYQNAVPISYELYDFDNNHLNYISATDAFNIPLCIPNDLSNATLDATADPNDANASYAYIKTGNNSGDNKDHDTHWSFGIFDSNGNSVASFHDDSNNDTYNDGTTTGHLYARSQMPATFGSFLNGTNGGRIHINIAPKGNDTWNIDEFTLYLRFTKPSTTQKLTWTGINLNEGKRDIDLNFSYDKNTNTLQVSPNY